MDMLSWAIGFASGVLMVGVITLVLRWLNEQPREAQQRMPGRPRQHFGPPSRDMPLIGGP